MICYDCNNYYVIVYDYFLQMIEKKIQKTNTNMYVNISVKIILIY